MNDIPAYEPAATTFRDGAFQLRSHAGGTVRGMAEQAKSQVAGSLDGLVQLAHEIVSRLGAADSSPVARFGHQAAGALSDWSATVHDKSVDELLEDSRAIVRRSPALALGVAVATGFALSRFLRSTADAAPAARQPYATAGGIG